MSENKKGKKILVIDDEEDTVIYMETLLQDNGYDTIAASNGEEGLEKLKSENPDLVVLDVSMPEKSGMRFFKEVKSDPKFGSIPIVFVTGVTGYAGDKDALRKFIGRMGSIPDPDGFFSKPIERDEFLKKIKEILN
jgi:CheY-like chemotaxis protein